MKKKGFIINGVGENDDVDGFLAVVLSDYFHLMILWRIWQPRRDERFAVWTKEGADPNHSYQKFGLVTKPVWNNKYVDDFIAVISIKQFTPNDQCKGRQCSLRLFPYYNLSK